MKKAKAKKGTEKGAKNKKMRDLEPLTGRTSKVKGGGRWTKDR